MTARHFTAWLVNDPSCLDTAACDVTVLEDQLIGGDPDSDDDWSTDSSKPIAFHATTTIDARDGDIDQAISEAEQLMDEAGWKTAGDWKPVPNAYIVTVERI
ncbi:hypothetical protein H3146_06735 [Streptomyces sp. OF3]|uniref:Uncharacterized protein n=1 Tax=Streptomyces alkaliterrae TaxID=2213162 RepID=A0A7W3WJJ3_9ACTN|nr:hypothetical protein [Streptomyces alkaliterrae]MBB1253065.1 hypothetical protein [Streptomyces alkaliterrae]